MPITFQWYDDDKTIMLESFVPPWSWQDYLDASAQTTAEIARVDHQVITIADLTATIVLPLASSLVKATDLGIHKLPNWHGVIIVANSRMVQTMARLFQGARSDDNYEVYLENTLENALKRVEEIRSST